MNELITPPMSSIDTGNELVFSEATLKELTRLSSANQGTYGRFYNSDNGTVPINRDRVSTTVSAI